MAIDVKGVENVFKLLFEDAAKETAELTDIGNKILDNAIDVRQVLKSSLEGAAHEKTRKMVQEIAANYERALTLLSEGAGNIKKLIEAYSGARYSEKLGRVSSRTGPAQIDREELNKLIMAMAQMRVRMMSRHALWSSFLLNFTNLVHGIDSAQSLLLARPSWFERYEKVFKEGAGEVAGTLVSGLGFLVAVAKLQEPELYKLIDKMQQATDMFDKLHSFEAILSFQIELGGFIQTLIRDAAVNELESMEEFEAAFGRYIS